MIDHRIDLPATATDVLIKYKEEYLNEFEVGEVVEFDNVYFLSDSNHKVKPSKAERLVNNGFDDNDGYYRIIIGDQLGYRYQILE